MKKIAFIVMFFSANVEARRIVLDIPEEEIEIVETYVLDAELWLKDAWKGKVHNRREALITQQVEYLRTAQMSIPSTDEEILKQGMKRLGSRKKRETKDK